MNLEDLADCIVTDEQSLLQLEQLEAKIATKFNIDGYIEEINYHGTIRENLIFILADQDEDELVDDWHQQFDWYLYYIEENLPSEYLNLHIFIQLCNYHHDCKYKSLVDTKNTHYQSILQCGENNVIIPLIKYIDFGWVVFRLLADISNNDMSDFPIEHSGKFDKVKKYWLNWAKDKGY